MSKEMHVKKARQEEASYLIESDKRFRLELIDVSLVKDRATVTNDDRNWPICTFVGGEWSRPKGTQQALKSADDWTPC
ncbi:hypothetical protein ABVT39_025587 [Epinephelus coioides]